MTENSYQLKLIKRLYSILPDCVVIKNDPHYRQGIPDLTILNHGKWAALEVKVSAKSKLQPNQDYFVKLFNEMSFAAIVYPENEEEVLNALQQALAV